MLRNAPNFFVWSKHLILRNTSTNVTSNVFLVWRCGSLNFFRVCVLCYNILCRFVLGTSHTPQFDPGSWPHQPFGWSTAFYFIPRGDCNSCRGSFGIGSTSISSQERRLDHTTLWKTYLARIRNPSSNKRILSKASQRCLHLLREWISSMSPMRSMFPKPTWPGLSCCGCLCPIWQHANGGLHSTWQSISLVLREIFDIRFSRPWPPDEIWCPERHCLLWNIGPNGLAIYFFQMVSPPKDENHPAYSQRQHISREWGKQTFYHQRTFMLLPGETWPTV